MRPGIAAPDSPAGPAIRFLIQSALQQSTLCGKDEDCPERIFRCRHCPRMMRRPGGGTSFRYSDSCVIGIP